MFTGLVEARGKILMAMPLTEGLRLQIQAPVEVMQKLSIGASIAVQGACLTVTTLNADCFEVDLSQETLNVTNLDSMTAGKWVNLETCLTPSTAMGGHWVTGHVDACGEIIEIKAVGDCQCVTVRAPKEISKFIAAKGSVTLNGVSLTVNTVAIQNFSVNLIAHTLAVTTLKDLQLGDRVNIEVDLIARYVARLLMEQ